MGELQVALTADFGYVILATAFAILAHQWMGIRVGKARKEYGVNYPVMYANKIDNKNAEKFNCVQRGHQNSLEILPQFFVLFFIASLQFPRTAAVLGAVFVVGRIVYFLGYSTGNPKARVYGGPLYAPSLLGLLGICIYTAAKLMM
ncbi:hypothetical protein CBR_g266 [Chara braunii]|uniref:Glutathione S-transferase 3, mitochondrial n=1 Tax=Chara braunii TaxID=69332 RepID=A0A388JM40_CHABU|nr:hypothetical protein CBR_g266 [Chara braunii]|eukprot:GBG58867.1 hypothetical protein CBR_g266 [Chara braunii]